MPKKALCRSDFVEAALQIIAETSIDQLSMRKVASRLEVSAMAMYKHFQNKEELLSAALDRFIERADVIPNQSIPWEQWVEEIANNMYEALCQDRSWVPFLGALSLGEQANRVTECFIQTLCAEGFSENRALDAYITMIQLVIGSVCLRASLASSELNKNDSALIDPLAISLPLLITALKRA